MLSLGFKDQIYDIFTLLNPEVQVAMFSATLPHEALEIAKKFMRTPKKIIVKPEQLTLEGLKQFYIHVEKQNWKFDTLVDLYDEINVSQAIIFCNSIKTVEWLSSELKKKNFPVSYTHGQLSSTERSQVLKQFRTGDVRVLISTDLLGRGIDIQQVSLVLNYDLPKKSRKLHSSNWKKRKIWKKGNCHKLCND